MRRGIWLRGCRAIHLHTLMCVILRCLTLLYFGFERLQRFSKWPCAQSTALVKTSCARASDNDGNMDVAQHGWDTRRTVRAGSI